MGQDRTRVGSGGEKKINKTGEVTSSLDRWTRFRSLWLLTRYEDMKKDSIMDFSTDP